MPRSLTVLRVAVAALGALTAIAAVSRLGTRAETRDQALRREIDALRAEVARLGSAERGVLGEMAKIGAEIRLRETELAATTARLAATETAIGSHDAALVRIEQAQRERVRYLGFRLREMYKGGTVAALGTIVGVGPGQAPVEGLRYAIYLSERDARLLRAFRDDRLRLAAERERLLAERERHAALRRDADAAVAALAAKRREREALLTGIQRDRRRTQDALTELEAAARDLGRLVDDLGRRAPEPRASLDVRTFRGLLDWPLAGRVTAKFGRTVHPRFKTAVPHPGVDLEAPLGTDFRAVFDGRVLFASTLRGYGLTVIVDHGHEVASVYTHASVLLVSAGQDVSRGQILGKTGDSGSMTGPKLYFEIREGGRPVDPAGWMRRR